MAVTGESIGVIKMTTATDAVAKKLKIDFIRWVGATTAGHVLTLTDTAGNVLFSSVADGANFIDVHALPLIANGVILSVLGSGTLYLYLNEKVRNR